MKGKTKGIYWARVIDKEGVEGDHCIYPEGFEMAIGDKKHFNKLKKAKKIEEIDPPRKVGRMKKQSKIFKSNI